MLRFAKWAVVPAVVCLAATLGTASEADAAGFGISVSSGYAGHYGGHYCAPSYSVGYGSYGAYGAYGVYGRAPVRVYRYPTYYPTPSLYFNYGGHRGHHGHHNDHHGHHDDHHGHHNDHHGHH